MSLPTRPRVTETAHRPAKAGAWSSPPPAQTPDGRPGRPPPPATAAWNWICPGRRASHRRCGFSLIETTIATLVLCLLLAPLGMMMTQTSTQTEVSFQEQQAVHYVRELLDQLADAARNDTGPGLTGLVRAGGGELPDLLAAATLALSDRNPTGMRVVPIGASGIGLTVSPLTEPFQARYLQATPVDSAGFLTMPGTPVFRVTAGVQWQPGGSASGRALRTIEASIFLVADR